MYLKQSRSIHTNLHTSMYIKQSRSIHTSIYTKQSRSNTYKHTYKAKQKQYEQTSIQAYIQNKAEAIHTNLHTSIHTKQSRSNTYKHLNKTKQKQYTKHSRSAHPTGPHKKQNNKKYYLINKYVLYKVMYVVK